MTTPSLSQEEAFALEVLKTLRQKGFEAYFAGGCVRDRLMNVKSKDYDIATSASADEVQRIFPRTVPVGAAFEVVLVLSEQEKNPFRVEVATFRKDIGISDGRHPSAVERATAEEDVKRRDFTINGMMFDPIENKLLDWVGGEKDLHAKVLRSIGDPKLRIEEDHLRMLRAIRFESRLQFKMDSALWDAIKTNTKLIQKISAERIFEELTKMLTGPNADRVLDRLDESGLLQEIMPEALAMKGCEQPPEYHPEGDVWVHTKLLLKQCEGVEPEIGWGALLHDIGKPPTFSHEPPDRIRFNNHQHVGAEMAEAILKRLKASNEFISTVVELVEDHLKFKDAPQMRPAKLMRFLRNPRFPLHLKLHRIDCMASHQNLELFKFCEQKLKEIPPEVLKPTPLITGHDLIALGLSPGPRFREILEAVETEQLEGRLTDKDSAREFAKSLAAKY